MKTVFVTVGTTSFDDLIGAMTSDESVKVRMSFINNLVRTARERQRTVTNACRYLWASFISSKPWGFNTSSLTLMSVSMFLNAGINGRGYTDVVLQVGRGSLVPDPDSCPGLTLQVFRFKDSITEDIRHSDLVISHAGGYELTLAQTRDGTLLYFYFTPHILHKFLYFLLLTFSNQACYLAHHSITNLRGRWMLESDWLTNVLRCAILFRETHLGERSSRQLSWPHYSSVSLRQMISVISKVL